MIFKNTNLNRFAHFIITMIDGIDKDFLNRGIRIIEKTISLSTIRIFNNMFSNNRIADVVESISKHLAYWATKCFFNNFIAAGSVREMYNINLRLRENEVRPLIKEH